MQEIRVLVGVTCTKMAPSATFGLSAERAYVQPLLARSTHPRQADPSELDQLVQMTSDILRNHLTGPPTSTDHTGAAREPSSPARADPQPMSADRTWGRVSAVSASR